MSVLDDFARMRLYRKRASEFELLAETEPLSAARLGYRIVARHYRELADREEQSDCLKVRRREGAPAGLLNVRSFASFSNYGKMNNVQIVPKKPNVLTETHCNFWVVRPLHN